jgi:ABC-type transport system involved in multi-copper enzyme maturation permease subunit
MNAVGALDAVSSARQVRRVPWLPDTRLARAEFLKLRKRRGLLLASLALTTGVVLVTFIVLVALHAANPDRYKPAGGVQNFENAISLLSELGIAVAVLIGATAGAGDLEAGVFRSLVVTGRSRLALFAARIPGGLALLLPVFALAVAIAAVAGVAAAGSLPTPGIGLVLKYGLWLEFDMAVLFLVALGVAALLGSRATTLSVLIPFQLVVTPILQGIHHLAWLREPVLGVAIWQLGPSDVVPPTDLSMSLGAIVAVVLAWLLVALGAGGWRTMTRDA